MVGPKSWGPPSESLPGSPRFQRAIGGTPAETVAGTFGHGYQESLMAHA